MSGIDRSRPDPHGQGQAAVREPAVPPRTRPAERYDVTQGGPGEDVWRLAWPILLSQLVSMAPGLYDAVWLGRLGSGAQAAAGLATSVRVTMISVLMGLSGASGAVVARYVGAHDRVNANLAVLQAVILKVLAAGSLVFGGFLVGAGLRLPEESAEG